MTTSDSTDQLPRSPAQARPAWLARPVGRNRRPALGRQLIAIEEAERHRRSLERRLAAHASAPSSPSPTSTGPGPGRWIPGPRCSLRLGFVDEGVNFILVGPNGVGKTMLRKNLAYRRSFAATPSASPPPATCSPTSLLRSRPPPCSTPPPLDSAQAPLHRRGRLPLLRQPLRRSALRGRHPSLRAPQPIVLTTNKAFSDWAEVFPHATCVVTLVDRLVHRSEILAIDGDSYRLKEATERQLQRSSSRRTKKPRPYFVHMDGNHSLHPSHAAPGGAALHSRPRLTRHHPTCAHGTQHAIPRRLRPDPLVLDTRGSHVIPCFPRPAHLCHLERLRRQDLATPLPRSVLGAPCRPRDHPRRLRYSPTD